MRDIIDQLLEWDSASVSFAVAIVTRTVNSAPRAAGAAMAVSEHGTVTGSVSGGCVESAIVELATEDISTGVPVRTQFGVADDDAFAVGLTCGGTLDVCVIRYSREMGRTLRRAREALGQGQPLALRTLADGDGADLLMFDGHALEGSTGPPTQGRALRAQMTGMLAADIDGRVDLGMPGGACHAGAVASVFVHCFTTAPRMIVFGAIDFARAVQIGKLMGYLVTVCDARAVFATAERFPQADEVVVEWPHRYLRRQLDPRTVLCVLTHDAKFDVPLLVHALTLNIAYVGAMGSRRTCAQREQALREAGLSTIALARLQAPIGLDIGGRTPTETALSIAAEIIAVREHRSGRPLSSNDVAIHGQTGTDADDPRATARSAVRQPPSRSFHAGKRRVRRGQPKTRAADTAPGR